MVKRLYSLRLCKKTSLIFSPECGPWSLIKSKSKLFNSQLFETQCAVILRKGKAFDDVQASTVKEILSGIFYKKYKVNIIN